MNPTGCAPRRWVFLLAPAWPTLPGMRTPHTARYDADTPHDIPDGIPMPVPDAARALGISPEAVRNRLSRGTLRSEKVDGRVFVLIDRDIAPHAERSTDDTPNGVPPDTSGLFEEMRARIDDLRDQLAEEREARRRADTIIMQLTQANAALAARVPELEAAPPRQPPSAPETAAEGAGEVAERADDEGPQTGARRPWWLRWFGG